MKPKNGPGQSGEQARSWQSTPYANSVRHVSSGLYYARLRLKGKLIWIDEEGQIHPSGQLEFGLKLSSFGESGHGYAEYCLNRAGLGVSMRP